MKLIAASLACCVVLGCATTPAPAPQAVEVPVAPAVAVPENGKTVPPPESAHVSPGPMGNRAPSPDELAPDPANGCLRRRRTVVPRCSGVPPRPGEPEASTVVCDRCLTDGDCRDASGGRCVSVGGHACDGPGHFLCRYPSAACGGQVCSEPVPKYPPSARPR